MESRHYKVVLKKMMEKEGMTFRGLSRVFGSNPSVWYNTMKPITRNNKGEVTRRGMNVNTFLRLVKLLNGRVIVQWRNPKDYRDNEKWLINCNEMDDEEMIKEFYRHPFEEYFKEYYGTGEDDGEGDEPPVGEGLADEESGGSEIGDENNE